MPFTKIVPILVQNNPELVPFSEEIRKQSMRFDAKLHEIEAWSGGLDCFTKAYKYLGINYDSVQKGWYMREWAPNAWSLHLTGDFNFWNRTELPFTPVANGIWEIFLPENIWAERFEKHEKFKITVSSRLGIHDRIPAFAQYVLQDDFTKDFSACLYWQAKFEFQHASPVRAGVTPFIYEAHIGMAQEKEGLGTYKEFQDKILPRVKELGYNFIQLMAIQEHPYYGSFGYHVSSYYASSSRFGKPEELKALIDAAHALGIGVLLDTVHSHSVKNLLEGLAEYDGTELYFHAGEKGNHELWDSKLFNYGKTEVLQFLLSNLRFWMEEFGFDGFRSDGVTSMLYTHHGLNKDFNLDAYFEENGVDHEAMTYLQLANHLVHHLNSDAVTIAEDVSGFPGLSRPVQEGGIGFDFRLAMGLPDYWIRTVKEQSDEDWDVGNMWGTLINRRKDEGTIAYVESHDQALVGDQTLAFQLIGPEMYTSMSKSHASMLVDRGLSLLKLIRMATIGAGGEGYLNFMGNEFGHPDWIDFPRTGNNWSYQYARRQWSLADSPFLKYSFLHDFDKHFLQLVASKEVFKKGPAVLVHIKHEDQVLCFGRGSLLFLLNFSPNNSYENVRFPAPDGYYKLALSTDSSQFGGFDQVSALHQYETYGTGFLSVYLPARTGLILMPGKV